MKRKAIAVTMALGLVLAACASPGTTTTAPATTGPTTGAPTTAVPPPTTTAAEVPEYGGTLNLVLISDISDWSQGLTFC